MDNLNKWNEMTHTEMYRICEDRDEWRRLTMKATAASSMDSDDADR